MRGERGSPGRCGWDEGCEEGEKALRNTPPGSFFPAIVAGEGFGATSGQLCTVAFSRSHFTNTREQSNQHFEQQQAESGGVTSEDTHTTAAIEYLTIRQDHEIRKRYTYT